MPFKLLTSPSGPRQGARFDESLVSLAARDGAIACLWEAEQGLVVPRTYQRHESFARVSEEFAAQGWPITVRLSGGGVVPQGAGIVNLSMAYAFDGPPLRHSDAAYALICSMIGNALKEDWDVETRIQAVDGSFCDGRYNLAWGPENSARKVAGTAQVWRRVEQDKTTRQIVLVHALLLAAIDAASLTERANLLERQLGSGKRYDATRIASLHDCLPASRILAPAAFMQGLKESLIGQIKKTNSPTDCMPAHLDV